MKLRHSVACCMLALGTLGSAAAYAAEAGQGYYRSPAIHDNTLVLLPKGISGLRSSGRTRPPV